MLVGHRVSYIRESQAAVTAVVAMKSTLDFVEKMRKGSQSDLALLSRKTVVDSEICPESALGASYFEAFSLEIEPVCFVDVEPVSMIGLSSFVASLGLRVMTAAGC